MRTMRVRDFARGPVFALCNKVAGLANASNMHCLVRSNVEIARGWQHREMSWRRSQLRLSYKAQQDAWLAFEVGLHEKDRGVYFTH